jgi:hypothetical protein
MGRKKRVREENSLTLEELKKISKRQGGNKPPSHSNEAMRQLPEDFRPLMKIQKGEDFLERLGQIFTNHAHHAMPYDLNEHVVFGLVQLAHQRRDELGGSNRKSFRRIIPTLLQIKADVRHRRPENLASFLLNELKKFERARREKKASGGYGRT